jgi:hypothetical protein
MTNDAAGGVTPIQAIATQTDFDVAVHIVLPGSPDLVWPVHHQLERAARQIGKAMASIGARKLLYQVKT